eukprot:m.202951 g.202951  ORF g.202951 m.202951 type:complete len:311 (-) comp18445_c0_seq4:91-1023(-)
MVGEVVESHGVALVLLVRLGDKLHAFANGVRLFAVERQHGLCNESLLVVWVHLQHAVKRFAGLVWKAEALEAHANAHTDFGGYIGAKVQHRAKRLERVGVAAHVELNVCSTERGQDHEAQGGTLVAKHGRKLFHGAGKLSLRQQPKVPSNQPMGQGVQIDFFRQSKNLVGFREILFALLVALLTLPLVSVPCLFVRIPCALDIVCRQQGVNIDAVALVLFLVRRQRLGLQRRLEQLSKFGMLPDRPVVTRENKPVGKLGLFTDEDVNDDRYIFGKGIQLKFDRFLRVGEQRDFNDVGRRHGDRVHTLSSK